VRSTADRLEGELQRTSLEVSPADYEVASQAISEARELAERPGLEVPDGQLAWLRRLGRRAAAWWTGADADQAWAALHTASLALLAIEPPEVVKARLADLAATVVTTLSPGDLRIPGYLRTLELLAPARAEITALSGLAGAILALRCYTGFQYSYGLPLVQALIKAVTGAATGLLGVLLVQSGLLGVLRGQYGGRVYAVAIVVGYAQYLFTRFIDRQARDVLTAAGSRNDPAAVPAVPPGAPVPALVTTRAG